MEKLLKLILLYKSKFSKAHLKKLLVNAGGDIPLKLTNKEAVASRKLWSTDLLNGRSVIAKATNDGIFIIRPVDIRSKEVEKQVKEQSKIIPLNEFKKVCRENVKSIPEDGLDLTGFDVICELEDIKGTIQEGQYVIINISRMTEEVGHWCAACCREGEIYWFDSFGCTPPKEVNMFLNHHYIGADAQMQKINQSDCGLRCLYVIFCLQRYESFDDIVERICI